VVDWEKANCIGVGVEVFYPEEGPGKYDSAGVRKKVCAFCPIQQDCLDHAVAKREEHGIWGGTLPGERQKMIRVELGLPAWRWGWSERPDECARGHKRTEENTMLDYRGYRTCRVCRSEDNRRYDAQFPRDRQKGLSDAVPEGV
jgi:WhiB family redox-sensing transcriptional regulator